MDNQLKEPYLIAYIEAGADVVNAVGDTVHIDAEGYYWQDYKGEVSGPYTSSRLAEQHATQGSWEQPHDT